MCAMFCLPDPSFPQARRLVFKVSLATTLPRPHAAPPFCNAKLVLFRCLPSSCFACYKQELASVSPVSAFFEGEEIVSLTLVFNNFRHLFSRYASPGHNAPLILAELRGPIENRSRLSRLNINPLLASPSPGPRARRSRSLFSRKGGFAAVSALARRRGI